MMSAAEIAIIFALVSAISCYTCEQKDADVLILGAGLAGLGAAETLSKNGIDNFLILDQLDRVGGRVQSESFGGGVVELGPEWMIYLDFTAFEDRLHPFIPLIDQCNITLRTAPLGTLPTKSYNNLGEDISAQVAEAQARYASASNPFIVDRILSELPEGADIPASQGLRAGGWLPISSIEEHAEAVSFDFLRSIPPNAASYRRNFETRTLIDIIFQFGNTPVNLVVTNPEGYSALPQCLAGQFLSEDDPRLLLNKVVREVSWGDECVCAITESGERYCASYAIMTFSVGELQVGGVKFTPDLPFLKHVTLNQFDIAFFLKIFISFNNTFWDTEVDTITYNDEINGREYYPIFIPWGSYFPEKPHILEAVLTGDTAKRVAYQDLELTREQIAGVMQNIYGDSATDPIDIIMHDFIVSPYFYGAFSLGSPGLTPLQFDEINVPCGNMYFSGEAYTINSQSTAHGALIHGRETARRIVAEIQGPLRVIFINDSPRVEGNSVMAEFRTNRQPAITECRLNPGGPAIDCSSGQVNFTDLEDGEYFLRVIAQHADGEVGRAVRHLTITTDASRCGVHLVNAGTKVSGSQANIEFTSTGLPVSGFQCRVDNLNNQACSSPFILRGLSPGRHRVRVSPVCEGNRGRRVVFINI